MSELLLFVAVAAAGAWFQAVSGFGLGLIVIALAGLLHIATVPVVAATISLLALLNVATSLAGHRQHIDWRLWRWVSLGQVCGIPLGVALLLALDGGHRALLELLLGVFVLLGSASMSWHARPALQASGAAGMVAAGFGGGIVGGLFAASAPVIGWFGYRQPLAVVAIRATLLACFAVTTVTRTTIVAATGGLNAEVWLLAAASAPVVVLVSWLGSRFPPRLPEVGMRRLAFAALTVMGLWIVARALLDLVARG